MYRQKFFMSDVDELCHISEARKDELLDISLKINSSTLCLLNVDEYKHELDKEDLERHEYVWLVAHYADLLIRTVRLDPYFIYEPESGEIPHV